MSRLLSTLAVTALLAGCDGANPFQMIEEIVVTDPAGTDTETLDPNDPNTDIDSKFAFDPANSLTMNSVAFDDNGTPADTTDDMLIINNLPFDGPEGRYDQVAGSVSTNPNGITTGIYESRQTATTGQIKHYAVFIQGDFMDATSAAGRNWADFGNAGANINRSDFNLPASNEYVYVGVYAGTRTYDERGGLELITGDVRLLLDIDDFDPGFPGDGLQGDIVGGITNRERNAPGDTMVGDLPDISLFEVSFNTETGVWDDGLVATYLDDGSVRDTGTHSGLIAGPNGEEMGGYLTMEGVADIQTVTFQVVDWQLVTTQTDAFGNAFNVTTTGQVSGLAIVDQDVLQNLVDFGVPIGPLTVGAGDLPPGATIIGSTTETVDIDASFNAREIGIFVGDQL